MTVSTNFVALSVVNDYDKKHRRNSSFDVDIKIQYMIVSMVPRVLIGRTAQDLIDKLVPLLQRILLGFSNKPVIVGLSGGSMVQMLSEAFPKVENVDWSQVRFVFCDERIVSFDNPESTFGAFRKQLLPAMGDKISEEHFITINPDLNPSDCAKDYEKKLLEISGGSKPRLDLLLLGLGPDGHTCSLFPDHELLKETKSLVGAIDNSPKPPPRRITFTLPAVNSADTVLFITTGSGKAPVIKEIFSDPASRLPGAQIKPKSGNLIWVVDEAAVSDVPSDMLIKEEL